MSTSAPAKVPAPEQPGNAPAYGALDRYFKISERGSTLPREIRGGLATFFAMAYIIVLNPIILGSAKDMYGHQLDNGQLVTATAVTAAFTTLLMGVIGNVPIALAAGLGVNSVVALQLAPRMSWPDAMGMVVLAGLVVMLLVATGLRERVMNAVPYGLRKAISINPYLKVFVANGYYDLATPYYATRYTVNHLGLDPSLSANISLGFYEAGHMMYIHLPSLARLRADLGDFVASALPPRRA